ncbi:MAG: FAD-binding oxidoreductase [Longimicrobiales bacterium]
MKRRAFLRTSFAAAGAAALPSRRLGAAVFRQAPQVPPDLEVVTGDGRSVTLSGSAIRELTDALRGRVLLRGDEGYDDARRILNPSFDRYPALIAQVTGSADVATAVHFARDHGNLLLAVKCGGHSASGQSTCDRGMMIDLSLFRDVRVEPYSRTARVTGGSLLGALDHESMAHGLVVTMGTVSHTGVGGLVTGGGFGRVGRRFGLSVDNLLSVDVVTADGRLVHASPDENRDLFWGVRGGGGNFGIVTSFEFRLHPMQRQVVAGQILYPADRARDVLETFAEHASRQPDALDLGPIVTQPRGGGRAVAGFGVCWSGDANRAEEVLAPIRRLGEPIMDTVGPMDYVAVQRSGDVSDPRAVGQYVKAGFIPELPPALISAIVEGFEGDPGRDTIVAFQQSGGAIGRVAPDATAFAQRDAAANMLCFVNWEHGTNPSEHIEWIRDYWTHLEPYTHGFYVNDLEAETTRATIRENYRANHARLVSVKNRYDPTNLFRLNANVEPTV